MMINNSGLLGHPVYYYHQECIRYISTLLLSKQTCSISNIEIPSVKI